MFSSLCRYVKLLPEPVVAELSFRFFSDNGESERLMDRRRAPECDTQVKIYATCFPRFVVRVVLAFFPSVEFVLESVC